MVESDLREAGSQPSPAQAGGTRQVWHCGTLTYTKMGLVSLFAFMIWGDFCNTIMQTVVPSVMPLKLKSLGASNLMIGLFASSIPSLLQIFMNPYISFKSDRHRSRWGRRIPFILFTLPPLCLSLVGLAYGEDIVKFVAPYVQHMALHSPVSLAVGVLGLLLVAFLFFDQFVNAIFCGLFNDVVPTPLMGRFMGTMQIVGSSAGFLYNYFVFQYADTHMREIFLWAAALYFFGVGSMCLFVREGRYPEPTEEDQHKSRGLEALKSYFQESFCHKFYWTKFLFVSSGNIKSVGLGVFMVFFYQDMGLSLGDIGKAAAITSLAVLATAYFASIFIDRWHPLRITTYSTIFSLVFIVPNFVWLFVTLNPAAFFWLNMLGAGLIIAFSNSISLVAYLPFDMRLHPKSRFTQFCSAQTLLRSVCTMFAGVLGGLYFDRLKLLFPDANFAYRFWFLWAIFWTLISAGLVYSLYRQWHVLGGDRHFHVPAPWSPTGFEEQEQSPYVGPQTKWLRASMAIVHGVMLLSMIYLLPLAGWLWVKGWFVDLKWHLAAILPASAGLYGWWLLVERSLKLDLADCRAGGKPLRGIPHHGVFFLNTCALLLLLLIWMATTMVAVKENIPLGVLVLGLGNLVTNAVFIVTVLVLRRMERGHDPLLDFDGHAAAEGGRSG